MQSYLKCKHCVFRTVRRLARAPPSSYHKRDLCVAENTVLFLLKEFFVFIANWIIQILVYFGNKDIDDEKKKKFNLFDFFG